MVKKKQAEPLPETPPDPFEFAARKFERQGASRYMYDPVGFVRDCIEWRDNDDGLTDYQEDIMRLLVEHHRLAVRGPHGLGKTTTAALLILWFALTRESERIDWKVLTTAGAWRQLEMFLWPEVKKWATRIKWEEIGRKPFKADVEQMKHSIQLVHGAASAVAATNHTYIEGAHADSLFYIFDESKAIPPQIFDAAEGAFSGARMDGLPEAFALMSSTPGEPVGRFYDVHSRKPGYEDWHVRHIKVYEAMNAGRLDKDWAESRARQWGEDSAMYHNRVLGEFHSSESDGVVPLAWVEAAQERWHAWNNAGRPVQSGVACYGIDVARGGKDRTVIAKRQGCIVEELVTHNVASTVKVAALAQLASDHPSDQFVVDVIGVGAGVFDTLSANNFDVTAFSASGKAGMRDRTGQWGFLNARAASWWTLRDLLDPSQPGGASLALPPDDTLTADLVAPHWWVTMGNRVQIESKDDIRKRIGRSTDTADAVIMTLYYHWRQANSGGISGDLKPRRWDDVDKAIASELLGGEVFDDDGDHGIFRYPL
jgi:hypothetical protein